MEDIKKIDRNAAVQIAEQGTLLGDAGREVRKGVFESCIYLKDGHVYHIIAGQQKGRLSIRIASKRSVGEYLRWVDGLFQPGGLPDASNAVHYRAAKLLREII